MSKNHHGGPGPVPPGNRPHAGPQHDAAVEPEQMHAETGGDQEQDQQRRIGDFTGKGEHSRVEPSQANDNGERGRQN